LNARLLKANITTAWAQPLSSSPWNQR